MVTNKQVIDMLGGLPYVKINCSVLAEEAIHAAISNYCETTGIELPGLKKHCDGCCECCKGEE